MLVFLVVVFVLSLNWFNSLTITVWYTYSYSILIFYNMYNVWIKCDSNKEYLKNQFLQLRYWSHSTNIDHYRYQHPHRYYCYLDGHSHHCCTARVEEISRHGQGIWQRDEENTSQPLRNGTSVPVRFQVYSLVAPAAVCHLGHAWRLLARPPPLIG